MNDYPSACNEALTCFCFIFHWLFIFCYRLKPRYCASRMGEMKRDVVSVSDSGSLSKARGEWEKEKGSGWREGVTWSSGRTCEGKKPLGKDEEVADWDICVPSRRIPSVHLRLLKSLTSPLPHRDADTLSGVWYLQRAALRVACCVSRPVVPTSCLPASWV